MMQVIRKVWHKLRSVPAASTDTVSDADDYAIRIARELKDFNDCTTVHDLPPIFHYWSNTYLAPKLAPFGITDPEQFFFLYAQKFHARFPERQMRMMSIGSGNCDMEARMAQRLIENGITAFTIECLDINTTMLERGRELAATSFPLPGISTIGSPTEFMTLSLLTSACIMSSNWRICLLQ